MDVIALLDKNVSNMIAAGEVVERPASAVKELVENSIDAKANNIVIEIKNGGLSYIRVSDDGCGMSRNDAKTAFLRHATSKIKTEKDLSGIKTMGFRGEALAAIAAVSKITLFTKRKDDDEGTKIVIEGGEIKKSEPCGCPDGTSIIITKLFYNTPARLAFMKKESTEAAYVSEIIKKIAIIKNNISFKYIKDGKEEIVTDKNGALFSDIYSVWGRDIANALIEVNYNYDDKIKINGYISKPLCTKANRYMQLFYVNERTVKNKVFTAALEEAYKNRIMASRFPLCVLNIDIDPKFVDVNVHPSKEEIKFKDDKSIFNAIYYACKTALDEKDEYVEFKIDKPEKTVVHDEIVIPKQFTHSETNEHLYTYEKMSYGIISNPPIYSYNAYNENNEDNEDKEENINITFDEQETKDKINADEVVCVGEIFDTYLIAQSGKNAYIIDKHAAHERILFEEIKDKSDRFVPQTLVYPFIVDVTEREKDALMNNLNVLLKYGFKLEDFSGSRVAVRELPLILIDADVTDTVSEFARIFMECKGVVNLKTVDELLHTIACKAAIKAGSFTGKEERDRFVKQLLSLPDIKYCPHGRPVLVELTEEKLEKMFKRL